MKSLKILVSLLLGLMLGTSCQDDAAELGEMIPASEIQFSVTQDLAADPGGNTVILQNQTPSTIAMWDYGTGRSTRTTDTVRFAFKGDYTIKFSALTAGGVVEMKPVTITVTEDNLMYVNDPVWINISGGPGEEKTWLLDLDENGVSKFFTSPVYFSSNNFEYDSGCLDDGSCWTWAPEWAGNQWITDKGDYGTMTFSLKGGPFVTVDHKMIASRGVETGTYNIDLATMTLKLTGVAPLQSINASNDIADWSTLKILSLTENTMQLGARHKSKAEYMIFNYITKEYSDNWVPEEPAGDPNFDHGDQSEIIAVESSKTWKLDLEVPYNWADLEGKLLNDWNSRADIMATGWAPYGDADVQNIDNASITFTVDGAVTVTQDDGTTATGTYKINEKTNIITFTDVKPSIPVAGWVTAATTEDNQWKIVKIEKSAVTDKVTGIWFGARDPVKNEYMVFHFVQR